VPGQLESGERRTLIARTGLVDPDVQRNAGFMRDIDRGERSAPVYSREPSRIAVRQDVDRSRLPLRDLADDGGSVLANGPAALDILLGNSPGFSERKRCPLARRAGAQTALHAIQRPMQIDGGRPCRTQRPDSFAEPPVGRIGTHRKRNAIGRSRPDQRSAAHHHRADRFCRIGHRVEMLGHELERESRLVDDHHGPFFRPDRAIVMAADTHAA
jgi:hypothetical protein